jgi:hypothetical protein
MHMEVNTVALVILFLQVVVDEVVLQVDLLALRLAVLVVLVLLLLLDLPLVALQALQEVRLVVLVGLVLLRVVVGIVLPLILLVGNSGGSLTRILSFV